MLDTIIAWDQKDDSLGSFFNACVEDLSSCFSNYEIIPNHVPSERLNEAYISLISGKFQKFLFLAYSHGEVSNLTVNNGVPYISTTINTDKFKNSIFYTCSCHNGAELGLKLIEEGCISYIGYNNEFGIWKYNPAPFIECANYGVRLFLTGIAIDEVIKQMKQKYTTHIDNYNNDMFGAAVLVANRQALISHGQNITLKDFLQN